MILNVNPFILDPRAIRRWLKSAKTRRVAGVKKKKARLASARGGGSREAEGPAALARPKLLSGCVEKKEETADIRREKKRAP